ncbi:hypothetical protein ACOI1H_13365, partial [Loktanella sp. DJP18]|uniref:hypothetical protein n=1 Tax=Loktanella sp. DJP18 TaxID=3409788 RepID=UPI003BB75A86
MTRQGYRVWKFEREEGERSVNFWAFSLRSWPSFDDFRPLRDETDPNAIPLRDPAAMTVLSSAEKVLSRYSCKKEVAGISGSSDSHINNGMRSNGTLEHDADQSLSNPTGQSIPLWLYLIALLTVAMFHGLSRLIVRRKNLARRRAHRYSVKKCARFRAGELAFKGEILDINCFGIKLRHKGLLPPEEQNISVEVLGQIKSGRITWRNGHYAGVLFDSRLSMANVLYFVGNDFSAAAFRDDPADAP